MVLYTIGFSKKNARQFFNCLKENGITKVIDIRLSNKSQLAGFTKVPDLEYFLKEITGIDYVYAPEFAPTEEILTNYKNKNITWYEYEEAFYHLLMERQPIEKYCSEFFDRACLLCSEPAANKCHRRLVAEYLADRIAELQIVHL